MKISVTLAGFGGHGVLSMGLFLANAGMSENKKVLYVPSYGAEMRGGTANCTVSISDDRDISSPVVAHPEVAVVMNHPSMDKFEPMVKTRGLLLVNQSLVHRQPVRQDITTHMVPTQELANEMGFPSGPNMIMLGVLLELTRAINTDHMEEYLIKTFKGKYLEKIPLNMAAINRGMNFSREQLVRA